MLISLLPNGLFPGSEDSAVTVERVETVEPGEVSTSNVHFNFIMTNNLSVQEGESLLSEDETHLTTTIPKAIHTDIQRGTDIFITHTDLFTYLEVWVMD